RDPITEAREAAFRAGLKPHEFWRLTPHETRLWCMARADEWRDRYRLSLFGAWHAGAFGRVKRLPPLKRVLARLDRPQGRGALASQIRSAFAALPRKRKD